LIKAEANFQKLKLLFALHNRYSPTQMYCENFELADSTHNGRSRILKADTEAQIREFDELKFSFRIAIRVDDNQCGRIIPDFSVVDQTIADLICK